MNIRLTPMDVARVKLLQDYFLRIEPLGVELSHVDIVRAALRASTTRAGFGDGDVADTALELEVASGERMSA